MDKPSLRLLLTPPPIHTEELDSPFPESILLDRFGYLSDRTNATTAHGRSSRKKRIQVTFWVATPPRVSCFTVHYLDLKPGGFHDIPKVVCMDDDLVLLRISIYPDPQDQLRFAEDTRYFVYKAGTKNKPPSLSLVRTPQGFTFCEQETVLLRRRGQDMFFLAVLRWSLIDFDWENPDKYFDLHLYNSKKGRWSTTLMHLDLPQGFSRCNTPDKGIAIGGEFGSVGWVDLWKGILICDLLRLEDDQSLRYIPVPSPLVANPFMGYPQCVRDVIVLQGYIKFFEMNRVRRGENFWIVVEKGWVAATKKLKISSIGSAGSSNNDWEEDCTIKCADEVPVDNPVYAQMLTNLEEGLGGDTKPTLKRFPAGYPAMSLHDGDVVYIVHMPDHLERKAYVIALDMRNKTVRGVAGFGSGIRPVGCGFTYLQTMISKHLGIWSSTR